jgi:hypothetical protein
MRYRSTFDIGAMGTEALTWISGGVHDGKNFSQLTPTDNLADSVLHVWSNETGELTMVLYLAMSRSDVLFLRVLDAYDTGLKVSIAAPESSPSTENLNVPGVRSFLGH